MRSSSMAFAKTKGSWFSRAFRDAFFGMITWSSERNGVWGTSSLLSSEFLSEKKLLYCSWKKTKFYLLKRHPDRRKPQPCTLDSQGSRQIFSAARSKSGRKVCLLVPGAKDHHWRGSYGGHRCAKGHQLQRPRPLQGLRGQPLLKIASHMSFVKVYTELCMLTRKALRKFEPSGSEGQNCGKDTRYE